MYIGYGHFILLIYALPKHESRIMKIGLPVT